MNYHSIGPKLTFYVLSADMNILAAFLNRLEEKDDFLYVLRKSCSVCLAKKSV